MVVQIRKYGKIAGLIAGGLFVLLLALTLVLNYFFKDELIRYVIGELNKQVDTKINIDKVDFSVWRQFPNASVQFDKVFVQSSTAYRTLNAIEGNDTLLVSDRIYLEFNLFKLLAGKYQLKKVNIRNGLLRIAIDKESGNNFDIFIKNGNASSSAFHLDLNNVLFTDTRLIYADARSSFLFRGLGHKLQLKGNFSDKSFTLNVLGKIFVNQISMGSNIYVANRPLQLDANLGVADGTYQFTDTELDLSGLKLNVTGSIVAGSKASINLCVAGNNLSLSNLLENMPPHIAKSLNDYKGKGKTSLQLLVKGPLNSNQNPNVHLSFSIDRGSVAEKVSGIKLSNLDLEGTYTNGSGNSLQTSVLKFNKIFTNLGNGNISGNATLTNFSNSSFSGNIISKIDLQDLKKFLKLDSVEVLSGTIESSITASGRLGKLSDFKASNLQALTYAGEINLNNCAAKMKGSDYFFKDITGKLQLNNNIYLNNIAFNVLDDDFSVNGTLHNGVEYLLGRNKTLSLQADIVSRNLDLTKYFTKTSGKSNQEYSRELLFPDNIELDVKLMVNNFTLHKFKAKWITGYLKYTPRMFVLKSISLETLSGRVTGNGAILQDLYKNFIVKGQADISKIDIRQMFYAFNNFTQNVLQDKHLRGRVSGKVNFSSEWNNQLVLQKDKILVDSDITISNGELVNFEPLNGLSRFISLSELQNIKFSTLTNRIYIKDKQIIIPQMDIQSSAFNIVGSGTHYFDNHYNYKVKVLLSDVLAGKARRAKKENNEFGIVEDDGLGKTSIYLSIEGLGSDYKISYDSRKALDVVKSSFAKQKFELKDALNKEFGWFKNDSSVIKRRNLKSSAVSVEWEEVPEEITDKPTDQTKPKKDKDKKPVQEDKVRVEFE